MSTAGTFLSRRGSDERAEIVEGIGFSGLQQSFHHALSRADSLTGIIQISEGRKITRRRSQRCFRSLTV